MVIPQVERLTVLRSSLTAIHAAYRMPIQVRDCMREAAKQDVNSNAGGGSLRTGPEEQPPPSVMAAARSTTHSRQLSPENDVLVEQLQQLCSVEISRDYLAHVLTVGCKGSMQAAAEFLLEFHDELPAREAAFLRCCQESEMRRRDEQLAMDSSRKTIIARQVAGFSMHPACLVHPAILLYNLCLARNDDLGFCFRFALQEVKESSENKRKEAAVLLPMGANAKKADAKPEVGVTCPLQRVRHSTAVYMIEICNVLTFASDMFFMR